MKRSRWAQVKQARGTTLALRVRTGALELVNPRLGKSSATNGGAAAAEAATPDHRRLSYKRGTNERVRSSVKCVCIILIDYRFRRMLRS